MPHEFKEVDYSEVEMRILALTSEEPLTVEEVALKLYGIVTYKTRQKAKAILFARHYGTTTRGGKLV